MFFVFKSEKRSEQSERDNESIMVTKKIIEKKKCEHYGASVRK